MVNLFNHVAGRRLLVQLLQQQIGWCIQLRRGRVCLIHHHQLLQQQSMGSTQHRSGFHAGGQLAAKQGLAAQELADYRWLATQWLAAALGLRVSPSSCWTNVCAIAVVVRQFSSNPDLDFRAWIRLQAGGLGLGDLDSRVWCHFAVVQKERLWI